MSVLGDAHEVLAAADEPLHYREIMTRMLDAGWATNGKTPWDTLNARLAVNAKQHGSSFRFVRTTSCDGEQLAALLTEHEIGVWHASYDLLSLDEESEA